MAHLSEVGAQAVPGAARFHGQEGGQDLRHGLEQQERHNSGTQHKRQLIPAEKSSLDGNKLPPISRWKEGDCKSGYKKNYLEDLWFLRCSLFCCSLGTINVVRRPPGLIDSQPFFINSTAVAKGSVFVKQNEIEEVSWQFTYFVIYVNLCSFRYLLQSGYIMLNMVVIFIVIFILCYKAMRNCSVGRLESKNQHENAGTTTRTDGRSVKKTLS